jgi:hypothetical protein
MVPSVEKKGTFFGAWLIWKNKGMAMKDSLISNDQSAYKSKPLDGSQYHNVIEEQVYSELPPSQEEQQPVRARHLDKPQTPHPHDLLISVGTP